MQDPLLLQFEIPVPVVAAPPATNLSPLFDRANTLTMPAGALNSLVEPVLKLTAANGSSNINCEAFLFAGDHGIATALPVSAYPADITALMVQNFLNGGAAMSVLCHSNNCTLTVIDVGVKPQNDNGLSTPGFVTTANQSVKFEDWNVPKHHPKSYPHGTQNIVDNFAILQDHYAELFQRSRKWAFQRVKSLKLNAVILGEMGIGNTTAAAAIACTTFGMDPQLAVGSGTGISSAQKDLKLNSIRSALLRHSQAIHSEKTKHDAWTNAMLSLCSLGGFELTGMAGAFVGTVEAGCYVLLDGVICTAAIAPILVAYPQLKDWCLAGHQSSEPAHKMMLEILELRPFLDLNLRLGEGTGAAFALGLLRDTNTIINKMSTFDDLVPKI